MKRASRKLREIRFYSEKCGRIICVNSYAEQEYAKRLEADDRVENFTENCYLERDRFQHINPVGIRSSYLQQEWKTDFLIRRQDGTQAVREVASEDDLSKATILEQLELSRRYWEAAGVPDWRIALFQMGAAAPAP